VNGRLPAHLEVAGLRRIAEAEGGHAAVLVKGDADRGAITVLIRERGVFSIAYERRLAVGGDYRWEDVGPKRGAPEAEISDFCAKRRRSDPDSWLIELDVPLVERFVVNSGLDD
jgi:hypothetical protein